MVGKSNRTKEEKARIVMDALSSTTSIAEICRNNNVSAPAFYKWRDSFIAAGTAALEPGKSSKETKMQMEIEDLKRIIGELTVANKTPKKIQLSRRGGMR